MNIEPPQRGFKTFILIILIGSVAFFTTSLTRNTIRTRLLAGMTDKPVHLKVSNLTQNSATISWLTNAETSGFIVYGPTESLDLKEKEASISNIHHITLTNLKENTTYYFKIGVGEKTYDRDGNPYTFTSAAGVGDGLSQKVYGQILNIDGTPTANTLIYLNIKDKDGRGSPGMSTTLSTVTNAAGLFTLNLAKAKVVDLSEPFYYSKPGDVIEITARGPHNERTSVLLDVSQTQPTPTITLSLKGRLIDLTGQKPTQGEDIILPNVPLEGEEEGEDLLQRIINRIFGL